MKRYTTKDFSDFPSRYQARFFNSLAGYKHPVIIGTVSSGGIENVAVFGRVVHIGSRPPYVGVIFRPHTVRRDTLENIRNTKFFTMNHIHSGMVEQAHCTAAKFDAETSEFKSVGLTPQYTNFKAPYVKESRIKSGLRLAEEQHIKVNDTILLVGAVDEVLMEANVIKDDGFVDLAGADSLCASNVDAYYQPKKLARFDYPQPGEPVKKLPKNLF